LSCGAPAVKERAQENNAPAELLPVDGRSPCGEKDLSFIHYVGRQILANTTASFFDNLPATGFIRQAQLIPHVVPFSAATLWRKVKEGTFPAPVKLSDRVTAWEVRAVREFLDGKRTTASPSGDSGRSTDSGAVSRATRKAKA
jgi:prophage regulatory protein